MIKKISQNKVKSYKCSIFLLFLLFTVGWLPALSMEVPLTERLEKHVSILSSDSMQGRGLGTEGKYRAKEYIIEQFADAGLRPISDNYIHPFETRIGLAWVDAYNIAGYLPGSDPVLKDEYILIGAHYDHLGYTKDSGEKTIFPGADDNASGVAGIIEIARYFANNPDQLKRGLIVVAFDAEESGLLGAKYFVDNPPVELHTIKAMFSFDMIGMLADNKGLDMKGIASLNTARDIAETIAGNIGISIRQSSAKIERRTDTEPFGNAGIPATHIFTGTNSPYHKPTDTYNLLDYEGMSLIVNFSTELISQLASEPLLEPSSALIAHVKQIQTGNRNKASIGLSYHTGAGYHRYADEFFRANSLFNISTGIYALLPLSRLLALKAEILYDFNGSKMERGNFRRHSITTPFNIQFGTSSANEANARVFIFGGGYFRYNFAGKVADTKMDFDNVYNPVEWGYNAGAGIQIFRFQVSYTLRKALTGILMEDSPDIFDNNSLFSIGFRF
jgi:aminopeptidase YwaD